MLRKIVLQRGPKKTSTTSFDTKKVSTSSSVEEEEQDMKTRKGKPYDKWVKFRKKMGEAVITRKTRIKAIADFVQKILPELAFPRTETVVK